MTKDRASQTRTSQSNRWMIAGPALAIFSGIGLLIGWQANETVVDITHALSVGAPLIVLSPNDLRLLPLTLSFFTLAAMCFYNPRRQRPPGKEGRGPGLLMGGVIITLVLSAVAGPVGTVVVSTIVTRQGYVACPAVGWERPMHRMARWGRPEAACPDPDGPRPARE